MPSTDTDWMPKSIDLLHTTFGTPGVVVVVAVVVVVVTAVVVVVVTTAVVVGSPTIFRK